MDKIDARTLPQEVLEHLRRQAFLLREKGYTWAHIAEVCGVNIWTVMNWSRRARRGSTLHPDFRPFSESAFSAGAGFKVMIVKVLWWHVCNSHLQT